MKNNMKEISFYKLTTLPILKAAPKLIEKIYYSKQNLVVIVEDSSTLESLDNVLWSYSTKHFIAHATANDSQPEKQPVYLTSGFENPNQAKLVMAIGEVNIDEFVADKYFYLFDSNDKGQLSFARKQWKMLNQKYKDQECTIVYWQQNEEGSWEKQ